MIKNYLKIAWKVLGRNKFFTFVSLFGISLTIGILLVLTALFGHITGANYPESNLDRTLFINQVYLTNGEGSGWSGAATFHLINDYIKKFKSPELVAMSSGGHKTNTFVGDKKLSFWVNYSCENFWKVHEFNFLEGKPITLQNIENNDRVAVISEATRDAYFGEGEKAEGKTIETDNSKYRVVGVVENVNASRFLTYADIYLPHTMEKGDYKKKIFVGNYSAILLAKDKSELDKVRAEYDDLVSRIEVPLPEEWMSKYKIMESKAQTMLELPAREIFGYDDDLALTKLYLFIFIAMFFFMLLPALNLVNLNSSRILERSSEIGVRKAFGATSSTLALQFIIENIALTFLGGMLGLLLAFGILKFIESSELIPYIQLGINFKTFLIALGLCLFFGTLSGVLPAIRMSKIRIVNALKGQNL